jgi:pullulanase
MGFIQVFILILLGWQNAQAGTRLFPMSLYGARAIWQDSQNLNYQPNTSFSADGVRLIALDLDSGDQLPVSVLESGSQVWKIQILASKETLRSWAKRSAVLFVRDAQGNELDRTYFQQGALLDGLYHYEGCLGVCWEDGKPVLKVWAPTARSVSVLWNGAEQPAGMRAGPEGTWLLNASLEDKNRGYLYEVEVFTPTSGRVEKHHVIDPYSLGLTENSRESVLLDPADWKPEGWDADSRPPLANRMDSVLYELHVREFSRWDESVPEGLRGSYLAFAQNGTNGTKHLKEMASAGLTHVHLLPVMDFASVDENAANRREPEIAPNLPPDSPLPQEEITRVRSLDSFNWGYDPYTYFAPEGSYAVNSFGGERMREFRTMMMSLHGMGLRVVLDVVYNHTFSSGLAKESVLDKIVPGYYYRLDGFGQVRNTSCCSDTASERWMMEKLMRDSVESWRSVYKVDGFRFDLMNLHGTSTMERLRDDLRKKDPSMLIYGEAWPFGSLRENDPNGSYGIGNAYGRSIGVFNDRLRDTLRGGTTDSKEKSDQGFLTGLFYNFNQEPANRNTPIDLPSQREKLLTFADVVRVGMAGSLRDFPLRDHRGNQTVGGNLYFRSGVVGFAASPEESINYVSAHDGYSYFDALQAKLPWHNNGGSSQTSSKQERVDRQILAFGVIALSQGMPFFDSGMEILRSKSGDQNSYDSGDWFNRLDWSLQKNNWGAGLPQGTDNKSDWDFWRPRLADPNLNMGPAEIQNTYQNFLALLRLRKTSPLFRLQTADQIKARVHFLDTELGPLQPPGVLVMEIKDDASVGEKLDPNWQRLIVTVNATNEPVTFSHSSLPGVALDKLYGHGNFISGDEANLSLAPRSITVWGQRQ